MAFLMHIFCLFYIRRIRFELLRKLTVSSLLRSWILILVRNFRIIAVNMLHGPCTPEQCIKNGRCSKKYPKQFAQETIWSEDGYPIYRRRNNGRTVEVRGHVYDNHWV